MRKSIQRLRVWLKGQAPTAQSPPLTEPAQSPSLAKPAHSPSPNKPADSPSLTEPTDPPPYNDLHVNPVPELTIAAITNAIYAATVVMPRAEISPMAQAVALYIGSVADCAAASDSTTLAFTPARACWVAVELFNPTSPDVSRSPGAAIWAASIFLPFTLAEVQGPHTPSVCATFDYFMSGTAFDNMSAALSWPERLNFASPNPAVIAAIGKALSCTVSSIISEPPSSRKDLANAYKVFATRIAHDIAEVLIATWLS